MESDAPYGADEFLAAEREMSGIARRASQKQGMEANAMFAKLGDVMKAVLRGKGSLNGILPMQFGLACCSMELVGSQASRPPVFRGAPHRCDVMIAAGWVARSMAPRMRELYEQMEEPRHVIAYGECAASGGPWWQSYNIVQGIDQVIPVDVYVVGCPPRPENLLEALVRLQDKIGGRSAGSAERSVSENIRREKTGRV
jgi:NADH-quinone oxidoreductase subunit B